MTQINSKDVVSANSVLREGGIILYPTDTVYGLGCDPFNEEALRKIIELKGRDAEKGLLVLVNSLDMIESLVYISDLSRKVSNEFHPGPLTLTLRGKKVFSEQLRGPYTESLAIRIPDNQFCLELLKVFGEPLVSTSANVSGLPVLNTPQEILEQFGDRAGLIDYVVDHGMLPESEPSTLVDLSGNTPKILREGAISKEQLQSSGVFFDE